MTEAEALAVLKRDLQIQKDNGALLDGIEAVELAIKALEKQIAKKILYRKQNYGTPWLCCECEADQIATEFFCEDGSEPKEKHTFCWKCGQKLDWSEVLLMIEKIINALEEESQYSCSHCMARAIEIVQEVAKEYDWIPVEQKTPEDFTYVYATCVSLVDDRKAWVIEGVYHSVTGWEELTPYLSLGKAKVIAWMPKKLPTPYQKGE